MRYGEAGWDQSTSEEGSGDSADWDGERPRLPWTVDVGVDER